MYTTRQSAWRGLYFFPVGMLVVGNSRDGAGSHVVRVEWF